jgi:tRNA (guanine37-N1)-methyltransferase
MRIDVVTIFPELVTGPLGVSLLGKAIERGLLDVRVHDLRDHGFGKHRTVDDRPYGGGAGMVMRPEPIFAAVEELDVSRAHVILMSPRGRRLDQTGVERLAEREHLVLICGRYEGIDERVVDHLVDEELSIGDYVLSGGELPALVVIEAVSRLVPGVLGNAESLTSESHAGDLLEFPQYTRPPDFRGWTVPDILLSGDHAEIERWRAEQARELTRLKRPDMLREPDEGDDPARSSDT